MAWGNNKSSVVQKAIEGDIDSNISASYLQNHKNATFLQVLSKSRIHDSKVVQKCRPSRPRAGHVDILIYGHIYLMIILNRK